MLQYFQKFLFDIISLDKTTCIYVILKYLSYVGTSLFKFYFFFTYEDTPLKAEKSEKNPNTFPRGVLNFA